MPTNKYMQPHNNRINEQISMQHNKLDKLPIRQKRSRKIQKNTKGVAKPKMRPVCVKCHKEMQPTQNGVIVYHLYEKPTPTDPPLQEKVGNLTVINTDRLIDPGLYKQKGRIDFVVHGDKYRCPICGIEIIKGFGKPMVDFTFPQEQLQKIVKHATNPVELRRKQ